MKCIILAAGRGTRMGALCDDTPKPMLPINGRPKLAYTVENLPESITEIVFIVGYLQETIRDFFGTSYDGRVITYIEQKELNGTGGAVMLAKDVMAGEEKFLVINGDDLYRKEDLEELMEGELALLACEQDHMSGCAVVLTDADGMLDRVIEFPHDYTEGLVNTGTYVLPYAFFESECIPKAEGSSEFGLPQMVGTMDQKTKIVVTRYWYPIGDPDALAGAPEVINDYI